MPGQTSLRTRMTYRAEQGDFLRRLWQSSRDQWRRVALLGLALWAVYSLIFSPDGAVRWMRLRHDLHDLEQDLVHLEDVRDSLDVFLQAFERGDPFALERVARERYGLVRKNERVLRLPDEVMPGGKNRLTFDTQGR